MEGSVRNLNHKIENESGRHVPLFKNILVPISSEYFSIDLIRTACFLAENFSADLSIVYIPEEETFDFIQRKTDPYRTPQDMNDVKKKLISEQRQIGKKIILKEIEKVLTPKNIEFDFTIVPGIFSHVIKEEVEQDSFDLVLMSYKKYCFVNYSVLDEIDTSIWVECGNDRKSLLVVCSNLSSNQIVVEKSMILSRFLDWDLRMMYIVDSHDGWESDDHGIKKRKKSVDELVDEARSFIDAMKENGVDVQLVQGDIEHEVLKAAKIVDPKVVVIGRGYKRDFLGFPVKDFQQRLVGKCKYSFLFVR